ncbi:hypothetical protein GCM10027031_07270 [Corynebacterium atrinae]
MPQVCYLTAGLCPGGARGLEDGVANAWGIGEAVGDGGGRTIHAHQPIHPRNVLPALEWLAG